MKYLLCNDQIYTVLLESWTEFIQFGHVHDFVTEVEGEVAVGSETDKETDPYTWVHIFESSYEFILKTIQDLRF